MLRVLAFKPNPHNPSAAQNLIYSLLYLCMKNIPNPPPARRGPVRGAVDLAGRPPPRVAPANPHPRTPPLLCPPASWLSPGWAALHSSTRHHPGCSSAWVLGAGCRCGCSPARKNKWGFIPPAAPPIYASVVCTCRWATKNRAHKNRMQIIGPARAHCCFMPHGGQDISGIPVSSSGRIRRGPPHHLHDQ